MTDLPTLLDNVDVNEQLDYCITRFPAIMSNFVYGYLFEDLTLRDLEIRYLNNDKAKGFFAKTVLNSLGVDTSGSNLGMYRGREVDDVCRELQNSTDPRNYVLAHLLKSRN